MKITPDEGDEIVYGDHPDFEVIQETIDGYGRWDIHMSTIVRHIPTDKHYLICWSKGATEQQHHTPFEHEEPELVEVYPDTETVVVWKPIKDKKCCYDPRCACNDG